MAYRNSTWMWADALEMLQRAERLQRQFFRLKAAENHAAWEPPIDLVESADGIEMAIALPGINPDRLTVGFEDGALVIEAVRPLPALAAQNVIHRLEIPYGRFSRRVALPPGRYALVEQVMSNGCLHLRLRRQG